MEPRGIREAKPGSEWQPPQALALRVENGRLLAYSKREDAPDGRSGLYIRYIKMGDAKVAVLYERVAFFIPEHVPDPSRRLQGEQLWVEATIPKKGPPRPIRLGVKKDGGPITPLDLE